MEKSKKRLILWGIILISLLEFYALFRLNRRYHGVHSGSYFTTMIIMQIVIWYLFLFKERRSSRRNRVALLFILLVTISTPILMLTTQPSYSYEEGKEIIMNSSEIETNYNIVAVPEGRSTVPVMENPSNSMNIFINNRVYHYQLSDGTEEMFLLVHPFTGEIVELEESFF